jgi:protein tyrosine phosphatase
MIANGREKIKDEYKAIQALSESLEKTCIASKANEKLNRYTNISPFDCNRVVLNDDEFENDYINASYINVRLLIEFKRKFLRFLWLGIPLFA